MVHTKNTEACFLSGLSFEAGDTTVGMSSSLGCGGGVGDLMTGGGDGGDGSSLGSVFGEDGCTMGLGGCNGRTLAEELLRLLVDSRSVVVVAVVSRVFLLRSLGAREGLGSVGSMSVRLVSFLAKWLISIKKIYCKLCLLHWFKETESNENNT